jgi:hypothetical protein
MWKRIWELKLGTEIAMLISSIIIAGAVVYHASALAYHSSIGRHQIISLSGSGLFRIDTISGRVEHLEKCGGDDQMCWTNRLFKN